ncbi:MAG TPA: type II toxin-antitoxin system Phd/YefM family antitoxin [Chthoniobacterales bacterium]|nr:type II toxin-antitoxin system Phd/YefM family antitoxin [Chthoniobacterales bacterium]
MSSTYSVAEAQAQLPALLKKANNDLIVITRRDKTVAYLVSVQRMEAIVETLELMADPQAMRALRRARSGKGKYYPLNILDGPDQS